MSDTDMRNCIICGFETDCIEGMCQSCQIAHNIVHSTTLTQQEKESQLEILDGSDELLSHLMDEDRC